MKPRTTIGQTAEKICPQITRETGDTTKDLYKDIIENDTQASLKRQSQHNKGIKFSPFCQGQPVWKRNPKPKTFAPRWFGPYQIIRPTTKNSTSYVIKEPAGSKEELIHFNNLKAFEERKKKFKRIQPRAATRDAQPKFMDTEIRTSRKKAARERKRSKMRSSCRENDTRLAKDRHQIILVV